ncbi:MAG: hypothetical protein ACE367_09405 [Acidimicrobiales bacterium]
MKTTRVLIALFLGLVLIAGACSTDPEDLSDEDLNSELVNVLTSDDALDEPTAQCVVDSLFETLDRDVINQLATADDLSEVTDEQFSAITDGVISCGAVG